MVQEAEGAPRNADLAIHSLGPTSTSNGIPTTGPGVGHMLLRYRDELIADAARRRAWIEIEDASPVAGDPSRELHLHSERPYQRTMASTRRWSSDAATR